MADPTREVRGEAHVLREGVGKVQRFAARLRDLHAEDLVCVFGTPRPLQFASMRQFIKLPMFSTPGLDVSGCLFISLDLRRNYRNFLSRIKSMYDLEGC